MTSEFAISHITNISTSLDEEKAALIIQEAWHRYVNRQVYKYYKNLLNFKAKGDPAEFLQTINPREAKLVDPAAGTHVRFRLGGSTFPPAIYYKIYTSGSVVDLGNFAPRYYTELTSKSSHPLLLHNKGFGDLKDVPCSWYSREENNDWRLVSGQDLLRGVYTVKPPKPVKKEPVLVSRQEQTRRMRRKKRIQWLKLYQEGAKDKSSGIHEMDSTTPSELDEAAEDTEIEKLLEWTNGLDFDDYLKNWMETGTSGNAGDFRGYTSRGVQPPSYLTK